jgi:hypothetical protein
MYAGRKSLPAAGRAAAGAGDKGNVSTTSTRRPAKTAAAADRTAAEDDEADDGESFDLSNVQEGQSQSQSQGRSRAGRKPLVGR